MGIEWEKPQKDWEIAPFHHFFIAFTIFDKLYY